MSAIPATARRSEPLSSESALSWPAKQRPLLILSQIAIVTRLTGRNVELQADLSEHHSPMRNAFQSTSRASTPRPSISPLSTASKPNRSPELTRDTAMGMAAAREEDDLDNAADGTTAENGYLQDDRSSSLSDPEDEQDEDEGLDEPNRSGGQAVQLVAQRSVDDDSEAETERLDNTPQKPLQHADSLGRTPSKLSQAATAEDELSEPPSPLQMDIGAASSTSTNGTLGTGMKRKRSDTAESPLTSAESDLEESPRKRSHEINLVPEAEAEGTVAIHNTAERATKTEVESTAPGEDHGTPAPVVLAKVVKGKKGKPKGRKTKDVHHESEIEQPEEVAEREEIEPSAKLAAKSEGERQVKLVASSAFEGIAKQFTRFREKLYDERLATMNAELSMLAQPDCQHAEYLRQVACVNARREKQMREAQAFYHYRLTSIRQRTLGDRSQLQSQYHQHIREMRESIMYQLGEEWHNIQKERRQQHQEKDDAYVYKFPANKSAQIRQQAKYNQEVSVLSGIAKYVGFPAAPDIDGAEGDLLEDDLKAMKITNRAPQPSATAPAPPPAQPAYPRFPTVPTQNEALAHQQYIEQNAWAQSQRPLHNNLGTPNLTHTPDWVDRPGGNHGSSARNLIRNLSGNGGLNHTRDQGPGHSHLPSRTGTPFATPLPQKRAGLSQLPAEQLLSSSGTVGMGSDGAEAPSSVLAAPATGERVLGSGHYEQRQQQQQQLGGGAPLLVGKVRGGVNGHGGGGGVGGSGGGTEREVSASSLRNISGVSAISGASTIDAPLLPAEAEDSSAAVEKVGQSERERNAKTRFPAMSTSGEGGALPLYERGRGFETNPLLFEEQRQQQYRHHRDDGRTRDGERDGDSDGARYANARHVGFGRGQEAAFETVAAAGLPVTSMAP
ncbi:Transcriptional regulatory protein [Friedmanniomyces endolithicus]|nr:Transcriptional regulatory protein [Friedmanniomyces endolithicus]